MKLPLTVTVQLLLLTLDTKVFSTVIVAEVAVRSVTVMVTVNLPKTDTPTSTALKPPVCGEPSRFE